MNKKEILAIVREHMADCAGVSQRDIEDHGEKIAFRLDRILRAEVDKYREAFAAMSETRKNETFASNALIEFKEFEKNGLLLENMALKLELTKIREYRKKEEKILRDILQKCDKEAL